MPFALGALAAAHAAPSDGPTAQLVGGSLVDVQEQQKLGLVTVGTCSGTLLNRFWVVTADHCVSTAGRGGPGRPHEALAVTATWTAKRAVPTRVVRYYHDEHRDIALLFLGAGDLGPAAQQQIAAGALTQGLRVRAFGRGVSALAHFDSDGRPVPTRQDGLYRSGDFTLETVGATWYRFDPQDGRTPSAGDSGAGQFLLVDGRPIGLIGVHSTSRRSHLAGQPETPDWISGVERARAETFRGLRDDIVARTREGLVPCAGVSAGCAAHESTALTVMLH